MLQNMSIKAKLLLVALPLSILFISMAMSINVKLKNSTTLSQLEEGVVLSTKISRLIHETQKERGMTAGFIGSNGIKFKDKLPLQRELTNQRLEELNNFLSMINLQSLSKDIDLKLSMALKDINDRNSKRMMIDSLTIKLADAIGYYSKMNNKFLNVIIEVSKIDFLRNQKKYDIISVWEK